jgi:hypothetical protein
MYGLEERRRQLLDSVSGLSDEALNRKAEEGRWTIAQILKHLYLIERGITQQLQEVVNADEWEQAPRKKPIEKTVDRTYKVDTPAPFRPDDKFTTLEEITALLDQSRKGLLKFVNSIDDESILTERSLRHFSFGRMDLAQWIEFIGWHEKRHLEQIEELKSK